MRPKPAYEMLKNLIHHEWRTNTEGTTDSDGCFRFRGFHGSYRVQTKSNQADSGIESSITLVPGKTAVQCIQL